MTASGHASLAAHMYACESSGQEDINKDEEMLSGSTRLQMSPMLTTSLGSGNQVQPLTLLQTDVLRSWVLFLNCSEFTRNVTDSD